MNDISPVTIKPGFCVLPHPGQQRVQGSHRAVVSLATPRHQQQVVVLLTRVLRYPHGEVTIHIVPGVDVDAAVVVPLHPRNVLRTSASEVMHRIKS